MMEKAYSLFLCVLFISVLFLPSTEAGRALLQTAQTASEASCVYERVRVDTTAEMMGVTGSSSKPAPSKTGVSSPSKPTPIANPDRAAHIHVAATEAYEVEVKWKIQNKENNSEGESGYHGGNDGSIMGVRPSHSSTAPSRTGVSSPSKPTYGRPCSYYNRCKRN